MSLHGTLALPLFEDSHRRFAADIARWAVVVQRLGLHAD